MNIKSQTTITYFINSIAIFFTIIVCIHTFKALNIKEIIGNFYRPEFYVNYSAGYTRRGLDGQIIYLISDFLKFPPWTLQKLYSASFFILFSVLSIYTIIKRKIPFYAVFSMSCLLLFLYYSANGFRKDHIILTLFLLNCYYISYLMKERLRVGDYIFQNIILIIGIFIHEISFLFSFFPLLILYFTKLKMKLTKNNIYILSFLFVLPTILFILNSTIFHGIASQEKTIIYSWKKLGLNNLQFYSGIFQSPHYIWIFYKSFLEYIFFILIFLIHYLFNISAHYNNQKSRNTYHIFVTLLSLQFIIAILLSIIASDFSRWIFYAVFTTVFSTSFIKLADEKSNLNNDSPILFYISIILYFLVTSPFSTEEKIEMYFNYTPIGIIYDYFTK